MDADPSEVSRDNWATKNGSSISLPNSKFEPITINLKRLQTYSLNDDSSRRVAHDELRYQRGRERQPRERRSPKFCGSVWMLHDVEPECPECVVISVMS